MTENHSILHFVSFFFIFKSCDVFWCIQPFAVAVIEHYDQGSLEKKDLF